MEPIRKSQEQRSLTTSSILALLIVVVSVGSLFATIYFGSQRVKKVQERLREQPATSNQQVDANATLDARRDNLKAQVGLELIDLFNRPEMRRARVAFATELLGGHEVHETRVLRFFEALAFYWRQDQIDEDSLYSFFDPVTHYWVASRKQIQHWRKKGNDKDLYRDFEELNHILLLDAEHRRPAKGTTVGSASGVKRFLEAEATLSN